MTFFLFIPPFGKGAGGFIKSSLPRRERVRVRGIKLHPHLASPVKGEEFY
jgi:hypothetical protein